MANKDKTPALYQITNLTDGRVYIGSTKDITQRFKQWISIVKRASEDKDQYNNASNQLIKDIVDLGWDNFKFEIIDASEDIFDPFIRGMREIELIMKHRSILPEYGYNATLGGESGTKAYRKVYSRKTKGLFLYDTLMDHVLFFIRGTKTLHEYIKVKPSNVPDACHRGHLVKNRYYIFHANTKERHEIAEYIKESRINAQFDNNGNNDTDSKRRFNGYFKALDIVDAYAKELGF